MFNLNIRQIRTRGFMNLNKIDLRTLDYQLDFNFSQLRKNMHIFGAIQKEFMNKNLKITFFKY